MSLIQSNNAKAIDEAIRNAYETEIKLTHPLYSIEQDPEKRVVFRALAITRAQETYKAHTEIEAKNKDVRNYTTITNTKRLPASKSIGRATFQASSVGISIQQNTLIRGQNGLLYNLQDEYLSKAVSYTIDSISSDGNGLITLTTNQDILELATNIFCDISGVADTTFNQVSAKITVTGLRTLTYNKTIPAGQSSGGTINAIVLPIVVESQDFGSKTEIINGPDIYLTNLATQDKAYVNFTNIIGGVDAESEASFLQRVQEELSKPRSPNNDPEMEAIARKFGGTTDAYVKTSEIDGTINVYHMRANSNPPFPTTQDNENLRNYLIEKFLPSGLRPSILVVQAPIQALYNLHFGFLPPSLKNQEFVNLITDNLNQLFNTYTLDSGLGQNVPNVRIEAVITNAIAKNYNNVNTNLDAIISGLVITTPLPAPTNLPRLGNITYTP